MCTRRRKGISNQYDPCLPSLPPDFFSSPTTIVTVPTGQLVTELTSTLQPASDLVVYSIIPDDSASSCVFIGADGTLTPVEGHQIDVIPQQYVSVTCAPRTGPIVTEPNDPFFTTFFPTLSSTCVEPTGTRKVTSNPISSSVPPPVLYPTGYPTGTGTVFYPTGTGYSTGGRAVTPTAKVYKRDWRQGMRA